MNKKSLATVAVATSLLAMGLFLSTVLVTGRASAQVAPTDLETRDGLLYAPDSDIPYTGAVAIPGEMQGNVKNGQRIGEWVHWYPDGQRAMVFNYANGLPVNRTLFHENGTITGKTTYDEQGRIAGLMQHWDANGTLRETHEWKAGVEHGEARLFNHNGNLQRTAMYRDGQKHGAEIWWYPDGGKLWETRYEDGKRTGTWSQFDPDGELTMQSTWADGKLVSRHNPHAGH